MRNLIKDCNVITLRNQYSYTTLPQLLFLKLLNNLSLFSFFNTLLGHDCRKLNNFSANYKFTGNCYLVCLLFNLQSLIK